MTTQTSRTRIGAMQNHGRKVAVIGSGSFGTTFGKILADAGNDVTIWARRHEVAQEIQIAKRNSNYLPGINLPKQLQATSELSVALKGAQLIFLAVPSSTVRETLKEIEPFLSADSVLVSLIKGVEQNTNMRMSEVIADTINISADRIVAVSGPNIALEIAQQQPTGAVAACVEESVAKNVAIACSTKYFRTYVTTDVVGTELGGVLKNLIALAIGIVDGVGYGENTKAAIITRGLAEMTEFAVGLGANPVTMSGRLIGQGYSLEETREQMSQTAEGITSVTPVLSIAKERAISMPIVEQVQMVLQQTMKPQDLGPHLATEDGVPTPEIRIIQAEDKPIRSFFKMFRRQS